MDNNINFEKFELSGISIDIIYDSQKLEEEITTSIKSSDNKACDDINKNNKAIKKENIEGKNKVSVLDEKIDASTQTERSYLDDDESSDEKTYFDLSYTSKKRNREGNDEE